MHTLKSYISGRRVLIVGSETYWVELYCALSGATEITTVDYPERSAGPLHRVAGHR
jgi:predicted nicotinamide N-methyase